LRTAEYVALSSEAKHMDRDICQDLDPATVAGLALADLGHVKIVHDRILCALLAPGMWGRPWTGRNGP
jgi:hypothetical protein